MVTSILRLTSLRVQVGDDLGMAEHGGELEGCLAAALIGLGIGTVLEEELDDLAISLEGDPAQGSLAAIVALFRIGTGVEEMGGGIKVAVVCGEHEEGVALFIREVSRKAGCEHGGEEFRLSLARGIDGLCLEFEITGFFFWAGGGHGLLDGGGFLLKGYVVGLEIHFQGLGDADRVGRIGFVEVLELAEDDVFRHSDHGCGDVVEKLLLLVL